ncbi:hypothetical protein GLOIN_2v1779631 [Rhizophagus irregularis DAOM 181602=DAOM 197198]|nr:hypothetical protein GLOIN_2v1779631 [Rhizophagus irregularis DAOM 181602=DAOM 197198]
MMNIASSTLLKNLGQVLPYKLEHLCLILLFNINDLIIFLKNSQNTFIEKLLIGNIINIIQNGKKTDHKNYEEDDDEVQKYDDLGMTAYNFVK